MKIVQELPKAQVAILIEAVEMYEAILKATTNENSSDIENIRHKQFDLLVFKGLLKSKVKIELTDYEYENFTSRTGVDFPEYNID